MQEQLQNAGCGEVLVRWKTRNGALFEQSGYIEVNCDAGWTKEQGTGSVGVVCRDNTGTYRGAYFNILERVMSPLVAEVCALREGLHFAWRMNYNSIELETDSKQLIEMLQGKMGIQVEVEVLVVDICHLAFHMEVKFQHVK
ncbi:hypothetical protein LIER_22521 [Lithospermum erythrorhizon]|uniref:RNase H type-1 domain-containing protein n=1 Tax=Lithospermum erythrorhizon TaxID=34254 RepID=A0AAV3QWH8_LITER